MSDNLSEKPAAPALKSTAEITIRVVVLGLILSVVMGAANVYVGLKAGMTVSASIPAAVMAMLLFRLFFKNSTILEANQVQTCASAGESLAAGIIFTMPAMILIGYWTEFDYWTVTLVAFTGGLLGILFMIPMRKVFVVDNDELKYPEGVACAAVLQAGASEEKDGAGTSLIVGGILGGVVKLVGGFLGLISGSLETAGVAGSRIFYFGGDLSPMLIAVGFIVRLNVAILIFIGGAMAWLIGIPLLGGGLTGEGADSAVDQAYGIWSSQLRYVGVGAMVVGGFSALIAVRHGLVAAIAHLWQGMTGDKDVTQKDTERDIPSWAILTLGSVCVVLLAMMNYWFTHNTGITLLSTVVILVMGFFFTAVASYIVGLVGNSNSPVSGMTITAVLVAGALLYLANYTGMDGMVATLGIAAIVCCVACTSGDVCNDLKTGSLVGASPFRQQMMQIAGVSVAALVMAPVLTLLHEHGGGIGSKELSAPQAGLFASLAKGFAGEGELPWKMIGIGAGLGFAILLIDGALKRSGAKFRAHLMPIAVGMYLPFGLAAPILIGGLIAHFYSKGKPEKEHDTVLHRGVLFSSGVIAGEALTAVGIAGLAAIGIQSLKLGVSPAMVTGLSCLAAASIVIIFVLMSKPLAKNNQ
ncbi:OPT oligopeptide transporter protein [Roseimaritima multifibrata]|uniref:OPT oligopeptide transporter protein n=1 Tax=Roseimaritima multifibrata TaxID=1930274 RepID=A0A517M9A9_9BACT|nr:oligopeptide transporter, OPT family [Roseimaritima multifibrata]QDS91462.1 OPT oligopeptide transporter protein [Roseimaritima multifibrata]